MHSKAVGVSQGVPRQPAVDVGPDVTADRDPAPEFTTFFEDAEPRLRAALVAYYGPEVGREATADALTWAWQHWDRVKAMDNAAGYLFRVGQTSARRLLKPEGKLPERATAVPSFEPGLGPALASLTDRQRAVVLLAHGLGLSHAEIARLLGLRRSTVQNHADRGLAKLRAAMEVDDGP